MSETRGKLKELLLTSKNYDAGLILSQWIPFLDEERALLLGSLGRHRDALILLLFQVQIYQEALNYCERNYFCEKDQVYTILYELLVKPPEPLELKSKYVSHENAYFHEKGAEPEILRPLELLKTHGAKIDLKVVLKSTPSNVPLTDLLDYLESAFGEKVRKRHKMQLVRGLMKAEQLQVQEDRIRSESVKVCLEEMDLCPICHRRFTDKGMVVRFPNGQVIHRSCQDRAYSMSPTP